MPAELTAERWAELVDVNHQVNGLPYQSDPSQYHRPEFWSDIEAAGAGDCEDYAIAKQRRLVALGWPLDYVRLAVCLTEHGEGHAVLLVDVADPETRQAGTLCLDNRTARPGDWLTDPLFARYKWLMRQKPGRWDWAAID